MARSNHHYNQRPPISGAELGSTFFKIGNPNISYDIISPEDGIRRYHWQARDTDEGLADIAGWAALPRRRDREWGVIDLPANTRPSSAVFSAVPAWLTEKDEILQFMAGYQQAVFERTRGWDTSMSLDTVGVPRGKGALFIVPPHQLESDQKRVGLWWAELSSDLQSVLLSDPRGHELINDFAMAMGMPNNTEPVL